MIMDKIPPELMEKLREGAKKDLADVHHKVTLLAEEAKATDGSFEAHVEYTSLILSRLINDPVTLSMLLTEALFMLADHKD